MKTSLKALLPLLLCSSLAIGEEYRSFTDFDYARNETDFSELDTFTVGSTWYFSPKETLGPLNEFEYVNTSSNIFGSWARLDTPGSDVDEMLIGGEYFAGNVLLGGSYLNRESADAYTATLGYLFSDNFLVSVDAEKFESFDARYFINARYAQQLGGTDYIGFAVRADDDFLSTAVSSRYFTRLAGERYLAAEATYHFNDRAEDFWALEGDYYFSRRTSLGLGVRKHDVYALDFTHFFNENVAVELAYTTQEFELDFEEVDFKRYQLGVTVQF